MTEPEKQELRVKLAELYGWKRTKGFESDVWSKPGKTTPTEFNLPDYPNDLNACAEFEKGMTNEQWWMYLVNLREQFNFLPGTPRDSYFVHATATQRCQAFVKTMKEKR